jgi:hypothetical protein
VIELKEAPDGILPAEGFSDIFTTNTSNLGETEL